MRGMRETRVNPLTLRQGTADCHWGCKVSFTSLYGQKLFIAVFENFKGVSEWEMAASYMWGRDNWESKIAKLSSKTDTHNTNYGDAEDVQDEEVNNNACKKSVNKRLV